MIDNLLRKNPISKFDFSKFDNASTENRSFVSVKRDNVMAGGGIAMKMPNFGLNNYASNSSITETITKTEVFDNLETSTDEIKIKNQLFDSLAKCKILSSYVSMHLQNRRDKLFIQLNSLMDFETWDWSDSVIKEDSFKTFLALILVPEVKGLPSIGCTSDGEIVAAWDNGNDRLIIECASNRMLKWVLRYHNDDEENVMSGKSHLSHFFNDLDGVKIIKRFNLDKEQKK